MILYMYAKQLNLYM